MKDYTITLEVDSEGETPVEAVTRIDTSTRWWNYRATDEHGNVFLVDMENLTAEILAAAEVNTLHKAADKEIRLSLTEYELSILTGALEEFTYAVSENFKSDADTATYLRGLILDQIDPDRKDHD